MHQKRVQNPERNVVTNIGSQLFKHLLNKQKSRQVIQELLKREEKGLERDFYRSIQALRIKFGSYYNRDKLRQLWFGCENEKLPQKLFALRRVVSYRFFTTELVSSLLTSKRLSSSLRATHLRVRRELLALIRNLEPNDF